MPILYLERHQATVIMPGTSQNPRAHINDIQSLLNQVTEKELQGHWRILFADDLVYQETIPLPSGVRNKKSYLSQQLGIEIPDKLGDRDWGFTTKKTAEGYEANIFAPVPAYWHRVRTSLETQKIPIEAITTVSLAHEHNKDIFEGAAKVAIDKRILQTLLPHNINPGAKHQTIAISVALVVVLIIVITLVLVS